MSPLLGRRAALHVALAGLGVAVSADAIWAAARAAPAARLATRDDLLDSVCDLVIPATTTPGALAAGVPDFVRLCLAHADGQAMQGDEWTRVAAQLTAQNYLAQDAAGRVAVLTQIDRAAFAVPRGAPPLPWRAIKLLIVNGYYTSEIGGSQELRYELVPGRFDPDVPVTPGMAELSNDWIAVDFR